MGRYVATLEARIQSLEGQLRAATSDKTGNRNGPSFIPGTECSEIQVHGREENEEAMDGVSQDEQLSEHNMTQENVTSPLHNILCFLSLEPFLTARQELRETVPNHFSPEQGLLPDACNGSPSQRQILSSDITVLEMIHSKAFNSDLEDDSLPALPSSSRAKALVDTVYFYTQARYCIIDWTQLREWHRDREAIAYTSPEGPVAAQTGK